MTVAGRLEAFFTVPSSVTISADTGSGFQTVNITAGSYTATTFATHLQARLDADAPPSGWSVSMSATTGLVTINTAVSPWSITFTSTALRDMIGFAGNISSVSTGQTGTLCHRGVWLPDCPLLMDGDPARAPLVSDLRRTRSPDGNVISHIGNTSYRHRGLAWTHVARAKMWEAVGLVKGSYEQWFKDSQLGVGHAWFTPGSAFHVINHDSIRLGADLNSGSGPTAGWKISEGPTSIEQTMSERPWVGQWRVEFGSIESPG